MAIIIVEHSGTHAALHHPFSLFILLNISESLFVVPHRICCVIVILSLVIPNIDAPLLEFIFLFSHDFLH